MAWAGGEEKAGRGRGRGRGGVGGEGAVRSGAACDVVCGAPEDCADVRCGLLVQARR